VPISGSKLGFGCRGFGAGEIKPQFRYNGKLRHCQHPSSRNSPLSHGDEAASPEVGHYPSARQNLFKMPAETVAAVPGAIYTAILNLHEAEAPWKCHGSETDYATDLHS